MLTDWIVGGGRRPICRCRAPPSPGWHSAPVPLPIWWKSGRRRHAALGGRRPVLAIHPEPAGVDVVIATELVEAARCCERGFVSPERTLLIAATRRVYATVEKQAMGDGASTPSAPSAPCGEIPARTLLHDPRPPAAGSAAHLSMPSRSGCWPDQACCPIPAGGLSRGSDPRRCDAGGNLPGSRPGSSWPPKACSAGATVPPPLPCPRSAAGRCCATPPLPLPADVLAVAEIALPRLVHYNQPLHTRLYLDRLAEVVAADPAPGGITACRRRWRASWRCGCATRM